MAAGLAVGQALLVPMGVQIEVEVVVAVLAVTLAAELQLTVALGLYPFATNFNRRATSWHTTH
tara:strand:- start:3 stop:191 length:189 start_codon:yes stop_codon:yes gene_type:complete